MSDRGMKKWAPYKSLVEQQSAIDNAKAKREVQYKPLISSDVAEEINDVLSNYHNETVEIEYWHGRRIKIITTISKIDRINQKIVVVDNLSIGFKDILNIVRV